MKTLLLAMFSMAIVDRVAVSVGNRIITESEIQLRIRLTAYENEETPVFDLLTRKTAVERLIDQKLVEREMDLGHYPRTPPAPGRETDKASLAAYSLSEADLQEDLARQADLLTFLNLRFRAGSERADVDLENWLKDQRRRTRIEYLEKELAP